MAQNRKDVYPKPGNPHHLHFDEYEGWEGFFIAPWIIAVFPIPLAAPIAFLAFIPIHAHGWVIPAVYALWFAIGAYFLLMNERESRPPQWLQRLFPGKSTKKQNDAAQP